MGYFHRFHDQFSIYLKCFIFLLIDLIISLLHPPALLLISVR